MDSAERQIANEYTYAVIQKRQAGLNGLDPVKPVQAPAEKPSHFYGDERLHTGVNKMKALR